MNSSTLNMFYKLKPFLPRSMQLFLRQMRARKIFDKMVTPYLDGVEYSDERLIPPNGYSCIVLLTHDVETSDGLRKIELVREIEREFNIPSTWNFVLKKYGSPDKYIDKLKSEGCECGAHGLYHDGKLFKDYETYSSRMDEIVDISEKLGLKGFRAPALHRNKDWMHNLPFQWDSSFPAWDPFQPQPGGCGKSLPFMLNNHTWELPVTLFQDFTLFFELKQQSIDIWLEQSSSLAGKQQLINIIVHPDYINEETLILYRGFILNCIGKQNAWIVTPSELCDWLGRQHE